MAHMEGFKKIEHSLGAMQYLLHYVGLNFGPGSPIWASLNGTAAFIGPFLNCSKLKILEL